MRETRQGRQDDLEFLVRSSVNARIEAKGCEPAAHSFVSPARRQGTRCEAIIVFHQNISTDIP